MGYPPSFIALVFKGIKMSEIWKSIELVVINEDQLNKAKNELMKLQIATEKEPGNIQFSINQSSDVPLKFILWERWVDIKALHDHLNAPYTQFYFSLKLTKVGNSDSMIPLTATAN